MPLDRQQRERSVDHGFDTAVRAALDGNKIFTDPSDGLMMIGINCQICFFVKIIEAKNRCWLLLDGEDLCPDADEGLRRLCAGSACRQSIH